MSHLGDLFEHHFQVSVGDYIPTCMGDVQLGHLPTPVKRVSRVNLHGTIV